MSGSPAPSPDGGPAAGERHDRADEPDAVTTLRGELEAVTELPVHERVAVFERANATIARELAALDEV